MKAYATHSAKLALILSLLAAAPSGPACAQPAGRRVAERVEGRRQAAPRMAPGRPVYAYPRPAAPPAYAPQPYAAPPYAYAPQPGYAPNSLGAGWGQQQDAARRGVRQGALMPLGQVMANIRRGTPGRLLDAGLEPGPGGRPAYRVRWAAANGRRIDFIVDAATGAVIGSSGY